MNSKKSTAVCAIVVFNAIGGSALAGGENDLWDGLYLQTVSGKNIEFKHNSVRTISRKIWGEDKRRVNCLVENPEKDHNLISKASAKEIKSAFFKPTAKYAAQMYEVNLMEVEGQQEQKPEKRLCYDESSGDLFPKSRDVSGGTQFQVFPLLKPNTYYLINKDYNTRNALIRFSR